MSKEMFMDAHDELIGEYMEEHPEASWDEAVEATVDRAEGHMIDKMADMAYRLRKEAGENGRG